MQNLLVSPHSAGATACQVGVARHYAEQTMLDHVAPSSELDYRDFLVSVVLRPMLEKLEDRQDLCVLTIEMANFDRIEAHHSRHAADHVMIKMAHMVRSELKSDELVARLLDRKLLVLSPGTSDALWADKLGERLRQICTSSVFRFGLTFQPVITWAACSTEQHVEGILGSSHPSALAGAA